MPVILSFLSYCMCRCVVHRCPSWAAVSRSDQVKPDIGDDESQVTRDSYGQSEGGQGWHSTSGISTVSVLVVVPSYRLSSYRRRTFSVTGPMMWNSLPRHLHDPLHTLSVSRRLLTSDFLCHRADDVELTAETSAWSSSYHLCFPATTEDIFRLFFVSEY